MDAFAQVVQAVVLTGTGISFMSMVSAGIDDARAAHGRIPRDRVAPADAVRTVAAKLARKPVRVELPKAA